MGNSTGNHYSTAQNLMKAFDKLPPDARRALANAAFDWAPQPILRMWRNGAKDYKTGPQIASAVAQWDRTTILKESKRVWGIGYLT